ncbi:HEXXH motif-containing putative peptide modification protein [Nonomuraea sp. NPDC049141]|uniref:aKG-HExxH-type peptide beta-hydroxylase n=1 Tax=Nonomuraea sp. NPDC049141 TaxID=3155500 RepID=UPI0033FBC791
MIEQADIVRSGPIAVADGHQDDLLLRYRRRLAEAVAHVLPRLTQRADAEAAAVVESALALYTDLPGGARENIVHHPYFSSWWTRVRAAFAAGDASELARLLPQFGRFVLVPAMKEGIADGVTLTLPTDDQGELRFPGHPCHVALGVPAWTPVRVQARNGELDLTVGSDTTIVAADRLLAAAPETGDPVLVRRATIGGGVELDGSDPAVLRFFANQRARAAIPGYPPRDLMPYGPIPAATVRHFEQALADIDTFCPAFGAELRSYVRVVVPVASNLLSTFTDTGFFGAIFMSEHLAPFSDRLVTAEHLLHEASHLRLTLILEHEPVFASEPDVLVESPWRRDARPLHQILHGTFVFARIAQLLAGALKRGAGPEYARRHEEVLGDLRRGLATLTGEGAEFTPAGRDLLDRFAALAHD